MKNYLYFSTLLFFLLVFILKDLHAQWVPIPIDSSHSLGNLTFLKVLENRIYAGTEYDIFLSVSNGNVWAAINSGLKYVNYFVTTREDSKPIIFAASYGNVFISSSYGVSWSKTNSMWYPYDDVNSLVASGSYLFVGTDNSGSFFSADKGNSWSNIPGLPRNIVPLAMLNSKLFAVKYGGGLYFSNDNGINWSKAGPLALDNSEVRSLAVSGSNFFAGTSGDGVFLSTDSGKTWSPVNNGLTTKYINTLQTYSSNIFAATDRGVFLSNDNGAHWINTWDGVGFINFYSLTVSDTYLFAGGSEIGLEGPRIFRRPLSELLALATDVETSSNTLPSKFYLEQNFPNPFNPSTKISWQSPIADHQTLKVYDVLGNEVATLVDEYKPAGNYEVTFDASKLSSGIYFYKLQAGNFVSTKKMVLLK